MDILVSTSNDGDAVGLLDFLALISEARVGTWPSVFLRKSTCASKKAAISLKVGRSNLAGVQERFIMSAQDWGQDRSMRGR